MQTSSHLVTPVSLLSLPTILPQSSAQRRLRTTHTSNPAVSHRHTVAHTIALLVTPFPFLETSKLYLES